jgi:hypothetical protein
MTMKCATRNKSKYAGYWHLEDLPVRPGDMVTIPKGTTIRTMAPGKRKRVAKRTYRVKVDHVLPGSNAIIMGGKFIRPCNPSVCWPGTGGYWNEVDINDIPEAK